MTPIAPPMRSRMSTRSRDNCQRREKRVVGRFVWTEREEWEEWEEGEAKFIWIVEVLAMRSVGEGGGVYSMRVGRLLTGVFCVPGMGVV